jgi:hypothetical protein
VRNLQFFCTFKPNVFQHFWTKISNTFKLG